MVARVLFYICLFFIGNLIWLTFAGRWMANEPLLMAVLVLRRDQTVAVLNEKLPSLTETAMSL
jgi:hypothetical protein